MTPNDSQIDSHTFGAKNMCSVPLQVSFSVENSINCVASSAEKSVMKIVEPGQTEFLMHVRRDDLSEQLTMSHEFKVKELE